MICHLMVSGRMIELDKTQQYLLGPFPARPSHILCFSSSLKLSRSLSRVSFDTPWTVAHQAPPSMGFSRQEYWSGLPFPSPGNLPDPGIEPRSPTLQVDSLLPSHQGSPVECKVMSKSFPLDVIHIPVNPVCNFLSHFQERN